MKKRPTRRKTLRKRIEDAPNLELLAGISILTVLTLEATDGLVVDHAGPNDAGLYSGWILDHAGHPIISSYMEFKSAADARAHMRKIIKAAKNLPPNRLQP